MSSTMSLARPSPPSARDMRADQRSQAQAQREAQQQRRARDERLAQMRAERAQQLHAAQNCTGSSSSSGSSSSHPPPRPSLHDLLSSLSSSVYRSMVKRERNDPLQADASSTAKAAEKLAAASSGEAKKQRTDETSAAAKSGLSSSPASSAASSSSNSSSSIKAKATASSSGGTQANTQSHAGAGMPHSAILTRCTQLPSPVRIPVNSIGLTYLHSFLSADECAQLTAAGGCYSRSLTALGVHPNRTSFSADPRESAAAVAAVRARVLEITGAKQLSQLEGPYLVRYQPGQEFTPHEDSGSYGILREYTLFVYLNTLGPNDGGETEFTRIGVKFRPKQGDALFWRNHTSRSSPVIPDSRHAGRPVRSGAKFGLNIWTKFP